MNPCRVPLTKRYDKWTHVDKLTPLIKGSAAWGWFILLWQRLWWWFTVHFQHTGQSLWTLFSVVQH